MNINNMEETSVIELDGTSVVVDDVIKRIKTTGVRGLDFDKAKEFGVFNRISNLLCATHASIIAARRIYGGVEYLMDAIHGKRNEIAKEMNLFDKAFDRFVRFWSSYYAKGVAVNEVNAESEALYRRIMEWAQLPFDWHLGDPQRVEDKDTTIAIRMNIEDKQLTFRTTTINEENLGNGDETWCVSKYNVKEHKQTIVEDKMDKASAMMVAKRLSDTYKDNIYTACMVQEVMERKTIVTPFKAYKENQTVGRITKQFK